MKFLLFILLVFAPISDELNWLTSLEKARQQASSENKSILLFFSGSDWCSPCIKVKKEYLSHPDFIKFASEKLILVIADFPRNKANKLSKQQEEMNAALAEKYNSKGMFPLIVLMDKDGKVIKEWPGVPKSTASSFVSDLTTVEKVCHASK